MTTGSQSTPRYLDRGHLKVDPTLTAFLEEQALPGTRISAEAFWSGFADLVAEFGPQIRSALAHRAVVQEKLDAWHRDHRGTAHDAEAYRTFLTEIGYIEPEGPDFTIGTENTDPEIAAIAGPQLVVPVTNARFVLNAANARWGSLYDALYGTDAMGDLPKGGGFDAARGKKVIAWSKAFLDDAVPLAQGSHSDCDGYFVKDGQLQPALADPARFVGYQGSAENPTSILLLSNGLHIILDVNRDHSVGQLDSAGISDLRLESAMSAIIDCEDSVAVVDGPDKAQAYGNWLGLMNGALTASFSKGGKEVTRSLSDDLSFISPDGSEVALKGRALLLVRNVGHLMTTPAVLDAEGQEVSEGLMDALITVLIAMHDLNGARRNSAAGSVYVVKPKMHGSAEVALTDAMFTAVEKILGLPQYTVKIGIMDEERRTSVNLKECIRAARNRVAFINTGFLDRTGDEIHSGMEAGPFLRKAEMKTAPWLQHYEARNVEIGLACGLRGKAQIGKGMWAMPEMMADMLEAKIGHPKAGANCAWVPSPTAATLHATHYHRVNVAAVQDEIAKRPPQGTLDGLLTVPIRDGQNWSEADIIAEVENNCQGILGYVVRWVDQGVGCSKVPDIHDVGLMEDRATCRISSQALTNWLHHGIVTRAQVETALRKMANVVDQQNAGDPAYLPMAPAFDGPAFQAAAALIFEGTSQPSGYTEPLLHKFRAVRKAL
ncbi:malate synthase G [Fluviibacterium sp. S390]|uniref:malate synthase G n=1 Tax=Fluviibacterium sp. S390 TaxID=3415139 RepID=UPI003C7999EC